MNDKVQFHELWTIIHWSPLTFQTMIKKLLLLLMAGSSSLSCEVKSQSQHDEENTIFQTFFPNKTTSGVYVEIGALDGFTFSNTLRLHNCYNWNGVLVEGLKSNYDNLLKNVPKYRAKNVEIYYGAVCPPPSTEVTFLTAKHPATGGDAAEMTSSFKKYWIPDESVSTKVPCHPMSFYLKKQKHVDFFSLDVEGSELTALETIDFNEIHVDVFAIELDINNLHKNYKIRQYMFNIGYEECIGVLEKNSVFLSRKPSNNALKCPGKRTIVAFPDAAG